MIEQTLPSQEIYHRRSLKVVHSATLTLNSEAIERLGAIFEQSSSVLQKPDPNSLRAVMFRVVYKLAMPPEGRNMTKPRDRLEQIYSAFSGFMRNYGRRDWREAALTEPEVLARPPAGNSREAAIFGTPNQAARFGQAALESHYRDFRRYLFKNLIDEDYGDTEEILPTRGFIPLNVKAKSHNMAPREFKRETVRFLDGVDAAVHKLGSVALGNQVEYVARETIEVQAVPAGSSLGATYR